MPNQPATARDPRSAAQMLDDILRDSNVRASFSLYCRSGLVRGIELCSCGRCRKERGQAVTPTSELASKVRAAELDHAFRAETRKFLKGIADAAH